MPVHPLNRNLFVADNINLLRSLDNESIDLVCIDPPCAKNQTFIGNLRPQLSDEERQQELETLAWWGFTAISTRRTFAARLHESVLRAITMRGGISAPLATAYCFIQRAISSHFNLNICPTPRSILRTLTDMLTRTIGGTAQGI